MKTLNNYINEWKLNDQSVSSIDHDDTEYFYYRIYTNKRIKIFDQDWEEYLYYKDKVYINGEHIDLRMGYTFETYHPGIYKVEIDEINDVKNCKYMFYQTDLSRVPLFDTSKVTNMRAMFFECINLKEVPNFNTKKALTVINMFNCCENLENVPLFNINKITEVRDMFYNCKNLSDRTKKDWSQIYDFYYNDRIK